MSGDAEGFVTVTRRQSYDVLSATDGHHVLWHLDEIFVSISGKQMYLWRAADSEGEALDILVQSRRNNKAALKVMHKLLKKQG